MGFDERTVEFCSFLAYAPSGKSESSDKSKEYSRRIKQNRSEIIHKIVASIATRAQKEPEGILGNFFKYPEILIPVPRSNPRKDKDALWPARIICQELVAKGLGKSTHEYIERVKPVPKSAFSKPGERPTPKIHFDSIQLNENFFLPEKVILVDDIITLGSTVAACRDLLTSVKPNIEVSVFALMRTRGFEDFSSDAQIIDPYIGRILYNDHKADRDD